MNSNSNVLLTRIEIFFYSALITFMSGVHRVRAYVDHLADFPKRSSPGEEDANPKLYEETSEKSILGIWTHISQALIPLLIWMLLGFAAGFLIGMIRPR